MTSSNFIVLLCLLGCFIISCNAEAESKRDLLDSNAALQKRLRDLGRLSVQDENNNMDDDEIFNKLFPYDTILPKQVAPRRLNSIQGQMVANNPRALGSLNLEQAPKKKDLGDVSAREAESVATVVKKAAAGGHEDEPMIEEPNKVVPTGAVQQHQERPSLGKSAVDLNKVKSIAFNSREVRLMGPDQTEVEMKDDLATKVAVVFDNLRQETGQFLDQVNVKLDKGWTEFKQSVDKLVEQGKKQVSQL